MLPVKVGTTKQAADPTVQEAEQAVQTFLDEAARLNQMNDDFRQSFPDAFAALQEIKQQEDVVQEAIARAHPLVQQAKQDIGPFVCQRKFKKAHYDDKEFLTLTAELEDSDAQLLLDMVKEGHVKKITLSDSATGFFAQNPDVASHYQPAWRERAEMTPAVTVPKI